MKDASNRLFVYFRKAIHKWGRENYSDFPWRKTQNKWHALVAEIMLQRTRAEQVLPAYEAFSIKYPSPAYYLEDPSPNTFSTLGLEWRAHQLRMLARILSERKIPVLKEELLELPGIGPYIASAYLSLHAGVRCSIIDANVVRLYGRFFGFPTDAETRRKKWLVALADRLTPHSAFKTYNYAVLDFTRLICKLGPLCKTCPLRRRCAHNTNST